VERLIIYCHGLALLLRANILTEILGKGRDVKESRFGDQSCQVASVHIAVGRSKVARDGGERRQETVLACAFLEKTGDLP